MDFRQLRYVVALARAMHFTQAAEELGVAQPALSQSVALLEKRLGVSLFVRNSRRVQLTAAGRLFVERAEQILREVESLQQNMLEYAELLRGQVNIGTMVFFFFGRTQLPEAVAEFVRIHPGVELSLENHTIDDSLEALRTRRIDVALINMPENISLGDLDVTIIGHDEIIALLPTGHRFATKKVIALSELCEEPFISYKAGSTMHDVLNTLVHNERITLRIAAQSRNIILVRSLVSAGAGVSIGPKSYLMAPGPPITVIPLVPTRRVSIAMVTRTDVAVNPAARALIDFLRMRFGAESKLFELNHYKRLQEDGAHTKGHSDKVGPRKDTGAPRKVKQSPR